MPDISLCENNKCIYRFKCFRYRAVSNRYWQPWAYFNKNKPADSECKFFWGLHSAITSYLSVEDAEHRGKSRK